MLTALLYIIGILVILVAGVAVIAVGIWLIFLLLKVVLWIFDELIQNIDDAIKLYKMARHQSGTPSITDIPGIVAYAGFYIWQENSHQRELNIVAHVVNSGLYSDIEIAKVIALGGHQKRMPMNERRDMIDVVALCIPSSLSVACFRDKSPRWYPTDTTGSLTAVWQVKSSAITQ